MSGYPFDVAALERRLVRAWSLRTSSKWSVDNPACGQCSVTALAIQQLHGGEILKTTTAEGPHFYNRIDGQRYDFTASQFASAISYEDQPSSIAEALADTSPEQLRLLLERLGQLQ